jgi:hypothetical protein
MRRQEFHTLATVPQVFASCVVGVVDEVDCTLESIAVSVCNRLPMGMTKAVPCAEKTSRVGELSFTGIYLVGRFSSRVTLNYECAFPFLFAESKRSVMESLGEIIHGFLRRAIAVQAVSQAQ